MNTNLFTNDDGLRLIETFEGKPRLKARLCEGGRYELGYGVTFHLDGSPVLEGQTCTEDEAMAMFRNALQRFELAVMAHITVPLNSNQFSALVAFAYNVGEDNFKSSTVLRMVNQLRFEDAAASFGMWVFATRDGYKQALRGLLRRRYAEACLFLSYDWVEACSDEAVALQREKPASLPGVDRVLYKTPFSNILRVAQKYPLGLTEPVQAKVPVPASIALDTAKVAADRLPDSALPGLGAVIDGVPINLPIPKHEDELVLDQPAVSEGGPPDANGAELVRPDLPDVQAPKAEENTNSTGVLVGSPETASDPEAPQPPEASPASTLPPVLEREIIRPPLALPKPPMTIDVSKLQLNNIRVENGAKPMELSDRAIAFAIKATGVFVKIQARRGLIGMPVAETIFDIMGDAFIMGCVIAAGTWLVGRAAQTCGSLMRDHFLTTARTLTY